MFGLHVVYIFSNINALPNKTVLSAAYHSFSSHKQQHAFKMHSVDFQSAVSCKSPLRGGFYEAFIAP